MPWSRLLPLIVGFVLILGLVVWLIDTIARFYYSVAFTSPLLANLVLALLIALLIGLLAALIYYGYLFLRPPQRRSRPLPQAPVEKTAAAAETLRAVRQQVEQIQDEVARQALIDRSREIEENLARRAIHVVVFGTGSAGKTSIVNAIMGRIVGQVGAPMGTTVVGETHRFRLKGLDRQVWITDTPGILEAGIVGTEREQLARQLAAEADLLLFVLDNDLRKSEYDPLRMLAEIGKRSIVVFNKTDLYLEADREAIVSRLQQRVAPFVAPVDVVAVAANPQALTVDGERFQPEPDILPLLRRVAAILRAEGEDLVADNILLQSQRLGEAARQLLDAQRLRQAEQIVDRYQWVGAGVITVTPLPVVDLLATAAINAQMVVELGRVYGCEINLDRGKELAISLAKTLASLGIVRGAIELFSIALQTNVGTFVIGRAIQGVTAAYLTRIAGKSFIEYFRCNQDWGDGGMTEVVQEQFQLNRRDEFIRVFVQEAVSRVMRPLNAAEADAERKTRDSG
jgi:hypothetical protein